MHSTPSCRFFFIMYPNLTSSNPYRNVWFWHDNSFDCNVSFFVLYISALVALCFLCFLFGIVFWCYTHYSRNIWFFTFVISKFSCLICYFYCIFTWAYFSCLIISSSKFWKAGAYIYSRALATGKRIQVISSISFVTNLIFVLWAMWLHFYQCSSWSQCKLAGWLLSSVQCWGKKSCSCSAWRKHGCNFECSSCCWFWCCRTKVYGTQYSCFCWRHKSMVLHFCPLFNV